MQSTLIHRSKFIRVFLFLMAVMICNHTFIFPFTDSAHSADSGYVGAYGGFDDDYLNDAAVTSDNGLVAVGWTDSFDQGAKDFLVLKLNAQNEIEWQKTFGGTGNDLAYSVQPTADGGYIIAGVTDDNNNDILVVKLSANGAIIWQKTYGGPLKEDTPMIRPTTDSGYVLTAQTGSFNIGASGVWLLRLESDGSIQWNHTFSYERTLSNPFIQLTNDGFIIACTASSSDGKNDILAFKLMNDKTISWQHIYGGDGFDYQPVIRPTADGKYILAGTTHSLGPGMINIWMAQLDSEGQIESQKTIGQTQTIHQLVDLRLTNDDGFIVAANRFNENAREEVALFKFDSSHTLNWQKKYVSATSDVMQVQNLFQTGEGNFIVAGNGSEYKTDFLVMRTDNQGQLADCSTDEDSSAQTETSSIGVGTCNLSSDEITTSAQPFTLSSHETDIIPHFFCRPEPNTPRLTSVSPTQTLNDGSTSAEIWADVAVDSGNVAKVWAMITPTADFQNAKVVIDPTRIEMLFDQNIGKYKAAANGFSYFGDYKVTIYAIDDQNHTSLPVTTWVNQEAAADVYEEDDSLSKAVLVNPDHSNKQRHNFHDQGDQDWLHFAGLQGLTYTIEATNLETDCDVVLELYNSDGQMILDEPFDSDWAGEDEILSYPIDQDGDYYVKILQYDPSVYGADTGYDIKVYRPVSPDDAVFEGDVVASSSNKIVQNAAVTPHDFACNPCNTINGHYSIKAALEYYKEYTIQATAPGYETKYHRVFLFENGNVVVTPAFTIYLIPIPTGPLTVNISPPEAVADGAQWRIDDGAWHDSGDSVYGLLIGEHTISYKDVQSWNKPAEESLTFQANQTITLDRQYTSQNGSLIVTITPEKAIQEGAQWQINGENWHNSGETVSDLSPGDYTVSFSELAGWNKPNDLTANVDAGQTTQKTGGYCSLLKGDINNDGCIDLEDVIVCLLVLTGEKTDGLLRNDYETVGVDIDGDNQVGLAEAIHLLEIVSEQR